MNPRIIALATLLIGSASAQTLTTIYSFSGPNPAGLTAGPGGVLYGTMAVSPGSVYSLTPPSSSGASWTLTTLKTFGPLGGGEWPAGAVAIGRGGVLYGATQGGGQYCIECGVVYQLTPPSSAGGAWSYQVLYSFGGPGTVGTFPTAGVVLGAGGVIYGSTSGGGTGRSGTIFSLTPPASPGGSWTYATLYSFTGGSDGSLPVALRVLPSGLVGTASGGSLGQGTIFSLTPPVSPGGPWTFATIYTFTGGADGANPENLALARHGVLYGAASSGGSNGHGTAFSLTPSASSGGAWTFTTLYSFTGAADGGYPLDLIPGLHGELFGSAANGGSEGVGVVFKLSPPATSGGAWTESTLANFTYNDAYPFFGVTFGFGGALYGITFDVGISAITGTIFSLTM